MISKVVLVVCSGNIHRSVIAEHCLRKALEQYEGQFVVVSRGIQGTCGTRPPKGRNLRDYPKEWSCTKTVLDELGLVIPVEQQAMPVDLATVQSAAVILAMDRGVLLDRPNSLVRQFPQCGHKMRLFMELSGRPEDVPDCGSSGDPVLHRQVVTLIYTIAHAYVDVLLAWVDIFGKC